MCVSLSMWLCMCACMCLCVNVIANGILYSTITTLYTIVFCWYSTCTTACLIKIYLISPIILPSLDFPTRLFFVLRFLLRFHLNCHSKSSIASIPFCLLICCFFFGIAFKYGNPALLHQFPFVWCPERNTSNMSSEDRNSLILSNNPFNILL